MQSENSFTPPAEGLDIYLAPKMKKGVKPCNIITQLFVSVEDGHAPLQNMWFSFKCLIELKYLEDNTKVTGSL